MDYEFVGERRIGEEEKLYEKESRNFVTSLVEHYQVKPDPWVISVLMVLRDSSPGGFQ